MQFIVTTIFVALFAAALPVQGAEAPAASDKNAVIEDAAKTVDAFHAALAKGDGAAAQTFLDDSVRIFEQGWVERSKAEYAAHHLASDMEFSKAVKREQTARNGFLADDLAYVVSEGKSMGTFQGKEIDSIGLETMVLRRADERWKIVHIHWSSRNAKKK